MAATPAPTDSLIDSLTGHVADFIVGTRYEDIPADVLAVGAFDSNSTKKFMKS